MTQARRRDGGGGVITRPLEAHWVVHLAQLWHSFGTEGLETHSPYVQLAPLLRGGSARSNRAGVDISDAFDYLTDRAPIARPLICQEMWLSLQAAWITGIHLPATFFLAKGVPTGIKRTCPSPSR